jgi:hypothetical protein
MKIWRSYGSGHSANLSIVGEFKSAEDAELVKEVLKDFVSAELKKRYPDINGFRNTWYPQFGNIILDSTLAPNESEYALGVDWEPQIVREGATVTVSGMQTPALNGIVKLMLLKYPTEIKITGETGP